MGAYTEYAGDIIVTACGREWRLARPACLEKLWNALDSDSFGDDERLPYWVELWPASIALADLIQENSAFLAGKRCLDLGCGLGLTALAGAWAGASVIGMDYEEEALRYARKNAERNGVPQPFWAVMDWRAPAVRQGGIDVIWAGDIMYERRFVSPVLACMQYALAVGGRVWMAEPNRDVQQYFTAELARRGWLARCIRRVLLDALYIQLAKVAVALWEVTRG